MTEAKIRADDGRVDFVGLEASEAAGGSVSRQGQATASPGGA